MESLAISIDDIDVVFLVSPIRSDEQARLCGSLRYVDPQLSVGQARTGKPHIAIADKTFRYQQAFLVRAEAGFGKRFC